MIVRAGPDLAFLTSPISVGVRLDVMLGDRTLGRDLPATNIVLSANAEREVPHQLTYQLPLEYVPQHWDDPAAGNGQQTHLTVILRSARGIERRVDLGWYQHDGEWEETDDAVEITAMDLLQTLAEDEPLWPSSPAKGIRLSRELQRLAGSLPVVLDPGVEDVLVDPTIQWNTSRTKSIRDLATTYGFLPVVGPDRCLHAKPLRTGSLRDETYTAHDLLLTALRKGPGRKPNVLSVIGESEEGRRYSATATLTEIPFTADYGRVTKIVELDSAKDQATVNAALQRERIAIAVSDQVRPLTLAFDPRIELGDVYGFAVTHESWTEYFTGRVKAYEMHPTWDADMRVDVEVLKW